MQEKTIELYTDLRGGAKKVLKTTIKNYSRVISIFTFIALVGAIFSKLTFFNAELISGEFAVDMFVILFLYYSMYFSTRKTGIQDGSVTDAYIDINKKYSELRDRIRSDHEIEDLWGYCSYYVEIELTAARKNILRTVSIPYSDWENKYSDLDYPIDNLSKKKQKAIQKVRALKPLRLTPDLLLNSEVAERRITPLSVSPARHLRRSFLVSMLPVTVMSLFVTSIIVEIIVSPTWETAVYAAFKILGILITAFKGYNDGYSNVVDFTVNYINTQISFICDYEKWYKAQAVAEPPVESDLTFGEGAEHETPLIAETN